MSQKQIILALTSERGRSGKDTLIEELEKIGHKVHRVAFADILKVRCAEAIGLDEGQVWDFMHGCFKDQEFPWLSINELPESDYKAFLMERHETFQSVPRSPRWHLQQFGTDYTRNHLNQPTKWLDLGIERIRKAPEGSLIVVTDMRMANEYCALAGLVDEYHVRMVRMKRMWFDEAVDRAHPHDSDVQLIGFAMTQVVLNRWNQQADMVKQLVAQGGLYVPR
ncbi:deoxynucleoside monophosphate kinase [Pseudomonas phage Stalingrad]|uniref:Deoxynucleoside monophosphate kinase n=1 Tax=Pseudomonas phage Stalingrad TaxID=2762287 RepID=A0A7G8LJ69_9CAUD|nr:deoxynucleoside monophosphate kinase [Pseudomonas phage Stalingrad]